jgi:hypothetical protein
MDKITSYMQTMTYFSTYPTPTPCQTAINSLSTCKITAHNHIHILASWRNVRYSRASALPWGSASAILQAYENFEVENSTNLLIRSAASTWMCWASCKTPWIVTRSRACYVLKAKQHLWHRYLSIKVYFTALAFHSCHNTHGCHQMRFLSRDPFTWHD